MGADICNCRYCNSGGEEYIIELHVEELEQELLEARKVIFGDAHSDAAYWTAVERARQIEHQLKALEQDQPSES